MGYCFQLPDISGSHLPMALTKKGLGSQDTQECLCRNPTCIYIVHLANIFRYKTLKLSDHIRPLKGKKVLKSWERKSSANSARPPGCERPSKFQLIQKHLEYEKAKANSAHCSIYGLFTHRAIVPRTNSESAANGTVGLSKIEFFVFLYKQS
jgi:hypothetical protein